MTILEANRFSSLVGEIYDAAVDPAQRSAALEQVAGFVGGSAVTILSRDAAGSRSKSTSIMARTPASASSTATAMSSSILCSIATSICRSNRPSASPTSCPMRTSWPRASIASGWNRRARSIWRPSRSSDRPRARRFCRSCAAGRAEPSMIRCASACGCLRRTSSAHASWAADQGSLAHRGRPRAGPRRSEHGDLPVRRGGAGRSCQCVVPANICRRRSACNRRRSRRGTQHPGRQNIPPLVRCDR